MQSRHFYLLFKKVAGDHDCGREHAAEQDRAGVELAGMRMNGVEMVDVHKAGVEMTGVEMVFVDMAGRRWPPQWIMA